MTTYPHRIHLRRPHVNLWLVAAVVFAAAFAGFGAWVLVDRNTGGGATQDATTLIDRVNVAWSVGDSSTVATLFATDAVARLMGNTFVGAQAIGKHAAVASGFGGFRIGRVAPVSVSGDVATTLAEYRYGESGGLGKLLTVYQLRDGKILREWSFKLGATRPFANAVIP